jgi:hypothetical protein
VVNPAARLDSTAVSEMDVSVGVAGADEPPPPHPAISAVRPSNSVAAIDVNPSRDLGVERAANEWFMRDIQSCLLMVDVII